MTIIEKLHDLHKQATEERSHYYVGATVKEAAAVIEAQDKEIKSILKSVLYHFGVDGAKKVTTDALAARNE